MPDECLHIYGLIGFPLTHSFSAGYFREKFESFRILKNHSYQNFELSAIDAFPGLLRSVEHLRGLNVTIPYKKAIIPFLNELSPEAKSIGAVNTILIQRNRKGETFLTGDNTDWIGFQSSLLDLFSDQAIPEKALVLGSGGSSEAICFVLNKLGIPYQIVSRNSDTEHNKLSYFDLTTKMIHESELIINTTPLGMFPNTDDLPQLPYEALTNRHVLFDLIYNPSETKFLEKGRLAGARVMNGLPMLQKQADAAWELWSLLHPPVPGF